MIIGIVGVLGLFFGIFLGIFIENRSISSYMTKTKKEIKTRDKIIASLNKQVLYLKEGRI